MVSEIDEAFRKEKLTEEEKGKIKRSVKAQIDEEEREMRAGLLAEMRKKAAAKLAKEKAEIEDAEKKREERKKKLEGIGKEECVDEFFEEDENGRRKFIPALLGEFVKKMIRFKTKNAEEVVYAYEDGVYRDDGEIVIKETVRQLLGKFANQHRISETIAHIQQTTYDCIEDAPHLLNMNNGIFDLKERTLLKHDPDKFIITQMPVSYDRKADCPKIKRFLKEILNPRDIPCCQEWMGYCLWNGYPYHRAVMLIGEGENGKSTLLELMKVFVGAENTAHIPLQRFERSPFVQSNLEGKMVNIFADLSDVALTDTGVFKTLTGGDAIPSERKFIQKQGSFVNRAKLMYSCNKLPETLKDKTRAYFRRWIIWSFDNLFGPGKRDPHILGKLTTDKELSGLFNWALEGLDRLQENGEFTNVLTPDEMEEYYERLSSPVAAFIQDLVEVDPEVWITKDLLYRVYVEYCKGKRLPPLANNSFAKELKRHGLVMEERKKKVGDRRSVPVWSGISIKNMAENERGGIRDINVFLSLNGIRSDVKYIRNIRKNPDNLDTVDTQKIFSAIPDKGDVSIDDLIKKLDPSKKFSDEMKEWVLETVEKIKSEGRAFEPHPGRIQRV